MLKVLVKKQLIEIFRSYFYNAKKNKAYSKGATAAYVVLFVMLMVGVLGGIFTGMALMICKPMADAELACACIKRGRTFLEDPVKTIASIKKETFRSDGTDFWPDISEKQIAERMWEAQIKVVFPIIEKQRSIIVERYRKGIEALLPITSIPAHPVVWHGPRSVK